MEESKILEMLTKLQQGQIEIKQMLLGSGQGVKQELQGIKDILIRMEKKLDEQILALQLD